MTESSAPGVSRRLLFKAGAAGAGAYTTGSLLRPAGAGAQLSPGKTDPGPVSVDVTVADLPGLTASIASVDLDPLRWTHTRGDRTEQEPISATLEVTPGDKARHDLESWLGRAEGGACIRKDITINIRDRSGEPARRFNLIDCFPTHFSTLAADIGGPSRGVTHWSLEVRVNRIDMA